MTRALAEAAQIVRVLTRNAGAGDSTVKGTIVDCLGAEEVTFLVAFQDVVNGAKVTVQAAASDTNNTANMEVLEGAVPEIEADATSLDNKLVALTIVRPPARYVEIQVAIVDQNAPIDSIVAVVSGNRSAPVTQGSTVAASKVAVDPAVAA